MENFLPKNRITLVILFISLLVFSLIYFFSVRLSTYNSSKNGPKASPTQIVSAPYFIPPSSKNKEASVFGRVVKLDENSAKELKATHKILDKGGNIICLATTDDDKLKQQEGNTVTLVGTLPYDVNISEKTVLVVKYISFK